jgi:hypothetical protein
MVRLPISGSLAVVSGLLLAGSLHAQVRASLDAGAGTGRESPLETSNSLLLQPSLWLGNSGRGLDLGGQLWRLNSGDWSGGLRGRAAWTTATWLGIRARLGLTGDATWYPNVGRTGSLLGTARLELPRGTTMLWLGGGAGRAGDLDQWGGTRVVSGGGRAMAGSFTIRFSMENTAFSRTITTLQDTVFPLSSDTLGGVGRAQIPAQERHQRHYTDAELGLGWGDGPLSLELAVGGRLGDRFGGEDSWARVSGALALGPGVTLIAAGGRAPGRLEQGEAGRAFYQVGVRLSLPAHRAATAVAPAGAAALQVRDRPGGIRVIQLRVRAEERVELMGDFTDWEPVALARITANIWEVALPIPPGVYRLNIRLDGGPWMVPPGLTALRDEFNGQVGILVIE